MFLVLVIDSASSYATSVCATIASATCVPTKLVQWRCKTGSTSAYSASICATISTCVPTKVFTLPLKWKCKNDQQNGLIASGTELIANVFDDNYSELFIEPARGTQLSEVAVSDEQHKKRR